MRGVERARAVARRLRTKGSPSEADGWTSVPDVLSTVADADRRLLDEVRPYTMTSAARLLATMDAVDYVVNRDVPGAFAECGVWRGGSVLLMIRRLQHHGVDDRDIYLYDTFEGMTAPTEHDTSQFHDESALATWSKAKASGRKAWSWLFPADVFNLDEVTRVLLATGYPPARLHFVAGKVEDTLPAQAPAQTALLRLDTDWYESTKHELETLYPSLVDGGVLIIDDYGHWEGARRAVDEYFSTAAPPLLLSRVDYTGRLAIKR